MRQVRDCLPASALLPILAACSDGSDQRQAFDRYITGLRTGGVPVRQQHRGTRRRIGGFVAIDDHSNYDGSEPRLLLLREIIPLVAQSVDLARGE